MMMMMMMMRNDDDDDDDDDDDLHSWQKFSGMDNKKFDNYMSVDSHLVTSGVNTMKELCESHVGTLSVEREKGERKIAIPNPKLCRTLLKHTKHS
jgi:hypothetical protein